MYCLVLLMGAQVVAVVRNAFNWLSWLHPLLDDRDLATLIYVLIISMTDYCKMLYIVKNKYIWFWTSRCGNFSIFMKSNSFTQVGFKTPLMSPFLLKAVLLGEGRICQQLHAKCGWSPEPQPFYLSHSNTSPSSKQLKGFTTPGTVWCCPLNI